MRQLSLIIALILFYCWSYGQVYHQNHEIFAINKEAPHPQLFPLSNERAAFFNQKENSQWFQ